MIYTSLMSLLYCKNMVMGRGEAFGRQFIDLNRRFLTRMLRPRISDDYIRVGAIAFLVFLHKFGIKQ
ncbi:hypothetical protein [Planktothricoides sp. SR001]|uniref:hypothetical protein n=1 Tax=Planktothricoides sp. SR001 TaxID=1705388 RepID=UPI0012E1873A|nr:hypothetical protein [Planktothricoides sp. SR001]